MASNSVVTLLKNAFRWQNPEYNFLNGSKVGKYIRDKYFQKNLQEQEAHETNHGTEETNKDKRKSLKTNSVENLKTKPSLLKLLSAKMSKSKSEHCLENLLINPPSSKYSEKRQHSDNQGKLKSSQEFQPVAEEKRLQSIQKKKELKKINKNFSGIAKGLSVIKGVTWHPGYLQKQTSSTKLSSKTLSTFALSKHAGNKSNRYYAKRKFALQTIQERKERHNLTLALEQMKDRQIKITELRARAKQFFLTE